MKKRKNRGWITAEFSPALDLPEKQNDAVSTSMVSNWLTVEQAASLLELSTRMIYHYLEKGQLSGERKDGRTMISREALARFVPQASGRIRTTTPPWRQSPEQNVQVLTLISARLHPGQEEPFACQLDAMYQQNHHCLPGTAARHILRNQDDPHEITLVLVWRAAIMPHAAEREAALAALRADLAEVLDWDTAVIKEGRASLHT